jgi:hypothetical protein
MHSFSFILTYNLYNKHLLNFSGLCRANLLTSSIHTELQSLCYFHSSFLITKLLNINSFTFMLDFNFFYIFSNYMLTYDDAFLHIKLYSLKAIKCFMFYIPFFYFFSLITTSESFFSFFQEYLKNFLVFNYEFLSLNYQHAFNYFELFISHFNLPFCFEN